MKKSKNSTRKTNFYLAIIDELKHTTNLTKISKKLNISRQNLNYYLRRLKKQGFVYNKGHGWWELTEKSKNSTKYGIFLKKDSIRGHAYIWGIEIEKIPENWNQRIEILRKRGINYKLVGALKTTPRIKVLGRKVWLCNNHLRIYDTEKSSYYGETAKESRINSKKQAFRIVLSIQKKLGVRLNPNKIKFKKEHYALIRNDLAIDQNQKGIIWRIKDDEGEWLLIDDSLGEGGELENIGKKAFKTNPKLQFWWNDNKKHNFKVTPTFIMESIGGLVQTQQMNADNIKKHMKVLDDMSETLKQIRDNLKK